jgi:heparinase II/III-like protein
VPDRATLARWALAAATTPPQRTIRTALSKASAARARGSRRRRDLVNGTFLSPEAAPGALLSYFGGGRVELLAGRESAIAGVTAQYLEHRFDVLGSGWVQVRHGMECAGLEGHRYRHGEAVEPDAGGAWLESRVTAANFEAARQAWRLVDAGYVPIDWHLDIKSGWRWAETTWYEDIRYGDLSGVDVKVPWELARMQHLPQLAIAGALARKGRPGFEPEERYGREFRNEVLDFIATNPPRFGVNWRTTMDVAIRIASWLAAYDLFRAAGHAFDSPFEAIFRRSVLEHGRHILDNLEWHETNRGNHYLADVVGLLFVAAFLPSEPAADAWLALAVQELVVEAERQFLEDGGNFEASTSYHRLGSELLAFGAAIAIGFPPDKLAALRTYDQRPGPRRPALRLEPTLGAAAGRGAMLPAWLAGRLERAAELSVDLTKPNNDVAQIGDNDSGRFLKLVPEVDAAPVGDMRRRYESLESQLELPDAATYWAERHLDHRSSVAAINGLIGRSDLAAYSLGYEFETDLVAHLAKGARLPSYRGAATSRAATVAIGTVDLLADVDRWVADRSPENRREFEIGFDGDGARDGLELAAYPDFGAFVMRSRRVFLAIRCGGTGRGVQGGHAHDDQLSLELSVDGRDWIRDPGTYLYTALPERRNAYRSRWAHFAPQVMGPALADLSRGLFVLEARHRVECVYWGDQGFAARLRTPRGGYLVYRLRLDDDRLVVAYGSNRLSLGPSPEPATGWRERVAAIPFSPGYGIRERGG